MTHEIAETGRWVSLGGRWLISQRNEAYFSLIYFHLVNTADTVFNDAKTVQFAFCDDNKILKAQLCLRLHFKKNCSLINFDCC